MKRTAKVSFFLLAVLCLSVASDVNAQVAPTQGSWLISTTGTTTIISPTTYVPPSNWAYFGIIKGINAQSAVNSDKCLGGPSFQSGTSGGTITPSSQFGGINVFANGLGYSGGGGGDCTIAGTYYAVYGTNPPSGGEFPTFLYYEMYYNGTSVTPQNPDVPIPVFSEGFNNVLNTRFLDLNITGTSTVNVEVDYYLDGNEINTTVSERNPSFVKFWYASSSDFAKINEPISVVSGTSTVHTNIASLADGTYDLLIGFTNFGCSTGQTPCPFADSYIYTSFTVASGVLSATGTIEYYDYTQPVNENTYKDCGLLTLDNCISNAFMYLFFPSNETIAQFSALPDAFNERAPFVYVTQVPDLFDTLFSSATTSSLTVSASTSIGTITFISASQLNAIPLSSQVRTIIGILIWIMTALFLYYRTLKLFDHSEKTV